MASTQQQSFSALSHFPPPPRLDKKYLEADAPSLYALAEAYRHAAQPLWQHDRKLSPIDRLPFRLLAAHAIELCLSAYLLQAGIAGEDVRGFQHNLAVRLVAAGEKGLLLRKRTIEHLQRMDKDREYLMTRYNPAPLAMAELTRVKATLDELFDKTGKAFN
ncbi:MAG: hypothetical protein IT560_14720 [Alphaproteobacteria bacterium]|nr:hypothetical protein [Alphaproteobacteria bacterium]